MKIFDFMCAACGETFEAFVRATDVDRRCPRCSSPNVARQPVMSTGLRFHSMRRGRVVDMSSNACPCGCRAGGRVHRASS